MRPGCSALTGLFGCGMIDARFVYLTGEGGIRGVAAEERLVDG